MTSLTKKDYEQVYVHSDIGGLVFEKLVIPSGASGSKSGRCNSLKWTQAQEENAHIIPAQRNFFLVFQQTLPIFLQV